MANITKPNFSNALWASGGAIVAPSDVKIATGWTAEVPPFQWENYSQNRQDQGIAHILQHGISVWDTLTEYQAGTSFVQGSTGKVYVAIQTHTNQNPVTDTTEVYWADVFKNGFASYSTAGVFSFTVPPILKLGLKKPLVYVIGGGGGGGKRQATPGLSAGGGGGGGGYSVTSIDLTGLTSVSVTVGAGGVGATVANTAGGNGGSSSFGAFATAGGGSGGGVTGGGSGGVGSGGNILNTSTGPGGSGISYSNSATTDAGVTGNGGGAGGAGITFTSGSPALAGNPAIGPGGGGGGPVYGGNGANGFAGLVYITW